MHEVEIVRWSGLWRKDDTIRVGVRLADGRDALLTAFWGSGEEERAVEYGLVINGEDYTDDFIIPAELERVIEQRLTGKRGDGSVSLKDLHLF